MLPDAMKAAGRIFEDPMTLGTTGTVLAIQLFDEECLEWDPVFLEEAIHRNTGAVINEDVMQRIQAVSTLLGSPAFFESPEIFHIVCSTLLDPDTAPEQMRMAPTPVEMAWTCTEAGLLLGNVYDTSSFSPMVKRYCGAALMSEGLYRAPQVLSFADFPANRYPSLISDDESLMIAFQQEQDNTLQVIDTAINTLSKLYRQQLAGLAQYGGNEKLFKKIAGTKDAKSGSSVKQA